MAGKLRFRYRVKDAKGRIQQGRAFAANIGQVRRLLVSRGLTIIFVNEEKSWLSRIKLFKGVSAKDRSIVYRELATMLKSGVSITQAISIASETPNKRLKQVLRDVEHSLENGFPLSVAMAGHDKVFPTVEIGVAKAGEATGNLSKVLDELSTQTARSAEFTGRVRGAMIYPAFIVVVMVIIGSVIMTKVIPPIKEIFSSTGTELPVSTKILLKFTDILVNDWVWLVLGLAVFSVIVRLLLGTRVGRVFSSKLVLSFPVFGPLTQQVYLAQFNRTMALLINAGVPIIESVEIIADSTSNITFQRALTSLMRSLEQGAAISTSLQTNKYFPRLMTQLLYVGQQSGDLGGTAGTLADYFESEVDAKLRTFSALIEPFIIVILGLAVGFVIISVLQPIYNLTGSF